MRSGAVVHSHLFTGSDLLLSGYLAAESLLNPSNSVCLLLSRKDSSLRDEMQQFVFGILAENAQKDAAEAACANLTVTVSESDGPQCLAAVIRRFDANQVWLLNSGQTAPAAQRDALDLLLPDLRGSSIRYLNYVVPAAGVPQCSEDPIPSLFQASRLPCRSFHIPLIAGDYLPSRSPVGHAFLLFLTELDQLKREIEERYQDYFEYQSLRCCVPGDSCLNLVHVRDLARTLLAAASGSASASGHYKIVGRENVSFSQLCEWTGIAYALMLMSEDDPHELNAIDKLFAERTQALSECFLSPSETAFAEDGEALVVESRFLDEEFAIAELQKIRGRQSSTTAQKLARSTALLAQLEPKTAPVAECELTYFTSGSQGTAVVMINALGQGLRYWSRLISELPQHWKVIIWEPRGTASASLPSPFSLSDQVNDLDAILSHEGIETCHLVAWCTGPKVAIEFYSRRPEAVVSMVLLNGAYKCATTPRTLTSEYENHLEPLFRTLDRCPAVAPMIRKALLQMGANSEILSPSEMDRKELAQRVLSLKSRDLQAEIMKPFESETSTLLYARQTLEFYSCDIALKAAAIKVPVLIIGAEYDQIVSPEFSRQLAETVPSARYVQLSGANHYCLYEQAGRVAELIQDFFSPLEDFAKEPPVPQAAYAGDSKGITYEQ